LAKRQIDMSSVIELPDRDSIIQAIIDQALHDLAYKNVRDWFAYLEERVALGCPTSDEIASITERKATRDVLVHNRGVANRQYVAKAARLARFPVGARIEIDEPYHRETFALVCKIVDDMASAAAAKA
jgi:hypothetical protein